MNHPRHGFADGTSYTRRDPVTARVVYKAEVILRLLGPGAARAFMRGMRLDAAAARWPEVRSRRALLLLLVEEGRVVIASDRDDELARRRDGVRRTSGALTGAYEPGDLERLRDDWPA